MNIPDENKSSITYIEETAKKFLDKETSGGLLLIAATFLALYLGNSVWADSYHHFLKNEFVIGASDNFILNLTIEKWINDGLMAIFFLVAGMELKREVVVGELSTFKKASMPLLAALGGMIVPALIFVSLNFGTEKIDGWGIPMATDIAYSLGIIGLLGKRIPGQLKVLLIAIAIADDLGAILVIALFYSQGLSWIYLGSAIGVLVILNFLNALGIKNLIWYVVGGLCMWYCFLNSGIHPTISGVLLALTIPVKPALDSKKLKERTEKNIAQLAKTDIESRDPMQDKAQRKILRRIKRDAENARPPLIKLENRLIDFNAFIVIPVFAIANAGVKLDVPLSEILSGTLELGIILGLVLGKILGIGIFSYIGEKLGISKLDESLTWGHVAGIGSIAGIGFTMSLFITNLAFTDPGLIKASRISILLASLVAAVVGITTLLFTKNNPDRSSTAD